MLSPSKPVSPDRGSTTSPTSAPRSNASDSASNPARGGSCPTGNARPTPPCANGWKSPRPASANSKSTTSGYATLSRRPSENGEPPKSLATTATRRETNFLDHRTLLSTGVNNTVQITKQQVTGLIISRTQDNAREPQRSIPPRRQGAWTFPERERGAEVSISHCHESRPDRPRTEKMDQSVVPPRAAVTGERPPVVAGLPFAADAPRPRATASPLNPSSTYLLRRLVESHGARDRPTTGSLSPPEAGPAAGPTRLSVVPRSRDGRVMTGRSRWAALGDDFARSAVSHKVALWPTGGPTGGRG